MSVLLRINNFPFLVDPGYSCGLCQKPFKKPYMLKLHQQRYHHGKIKIRKKCPFLACQRDYADADCLRRHWNAAHKRSLMVSCPKCKLVQGKRSFEIVGRVGLNVLENLATL
jgi:hypothetical protein